jgi:fluoride exporter
MMNLKNILLVGLGGGIGAMLRFFISSLFKVNSFPINTLLINIVGSFIIGIVFAYNIKNEHFSEELKLFLATGICGGFTTFSAFSIENIQLLKEGNHVTACLYIFASIACCLVACLAGLKIINQV